jgi:DNA-binding response OmpR family regulator
LDQTGKSIAEGGELFGLRVLIAEDQWLTADTLAVLLEEEGATVIGPCATTVSAMKRIGTEPVDFALVDMGLKDRFSDPVIRNLTPNEFLMLSSLASISYQRMPTIVLLRLSRSPSTRGH